MLPVRLLADKSNSCIALGKSSGISPWISHPAKKIRRSDGNSGSHFGTADSLNGLKETSSVSRCLREDISEGSGPSIIFRARRGVQAVGVGQ
ncbi:hypothetical protein ACFX15_011096 [Malus domestica]